MAGVFDDVCSVLAGVLEGDARRAIVADAGGAGSMRGALLRLRDGMRTHAWKLGARPFDIARAVQKLDRKTRVQGFHVLNDWDGIADHVNEDIIPVDVLHYLIDKRGSEPVSEPALAVLLDYYFMHLLALLSVRVWDEGDADDNLDRIGGLLTALQGPDGSGQAFAGDAETLLLIATSHYELSERGYASLLERTRTLNRAHRARIALGHAGSMGAHLRFGFEATYGRDTVNMRDDNVADYPWLCFALTTVMDEYARARSGEPSPLDLDALGEALLNGLSADARAFIGAPPPSLASCAAERESFRQSFRMHADELLDAFAQHRPSEARYSPLCFFFNFSHNVVKGAVVDALLRGRPWPVALNDLLTRAGDGAGMDAVKRDLAVTLMGYARDNPHRIRGQLKPVIVYDVRSGREAFSITLRKLRGE